MKDSELLTEIKARAELELLGYTRKKCERCKGTGITDVFGSYFCVQCDRRGYVWVTKSGEEIQHEFRN